MNKSCFWLALVIITFFPTGLFAEDGPFIFLFRDYPVQSYPTANTRLIDFSGFPTLYHVAPQSRSKKP
jgi:hypothetical protein